VVTNGKVATVADDGRAVGGTVVGGTVVGGTVVGGTAVDVVLVDVLVEIRVLEVTSGRIDVVVADAGAATVVVVT
jgi:hypothetical protein